MPGVIQLSTSAAVLPRYLCEVFTQEREFLANVNDYADASSQRGVIVQTSRRKWTIRPKVKITDLIALRNFWLARKGTEAFYYYDFTESSPFGNFDITGAAPDGRFLVRFQGPWGQVNTNSPIGVASLQLVELSDNSAGGSGQLDFSQQSSFLFGM